MNEAITAYFGGEKSGGLVIALVGAAMLITAIVLFPAKLELRALAIGVGVWGLLQLGIGVGLFLKTDSQVAALLAQKRTALLASETPRIEKVQSTFVVLEVVWVVMIIAGALIGWRLKDNLTVSGIALAFVINAAILLAFDIVAERRGATYLAQLKAP